MLVFVLNIILIFQCNTQTTLRIGCNETISLSIDNSPEVDFFLLDIDINAFIVTANLCAPNGSFEADFASNADFSFRTTPCPGNEVGFIGTFDEEQILRDGISIRVFARNFGETGNYSITLDCIPLYVHL